MNLQKAYIALSLENTFEEKKTCAKATTKKIKVEINIIKCTLNTYGENDNFFYRILGVI